MPYAFVPRLSHQGVEKLYTILRLPSSQVLCVPIAGGIITELTGSEHKEAAAEHRPLLSCRPKHCVWHTAVFTTTVTPTSRYMNSSVLPSHVGSHTGHVTLFGQ